MSTYEKFEQLREIFGDASLLKELYEYFGSFDIENAIESIANDYDIEFAD